MITVTAEVENKELVVPGEVLEELGWREDATIVLEKRNGRIVFRPRRLNAKEIADLTCIYLIKYVGDATAVKSPIWKDGKWRVEVVLSYRPETIGFLTYSSDGALIESESDSPKQLKGVAS